MAKSINIVITTLLLLLLFQVQAALALRPRTTPNRFITNFDSNPQGPVCIPTDGLVFGGMKVRPGDVLRANSAPNLAGRGTLSYVSKGEPRPNITSKYTGSKVKYFELISTYVGCAVVMTGALPVDTSDLPQVQVPQPCTILFSGVNSAGGPISQTCSFSGTRDMQQCFFGKSFVSAVAVNVEIKTAATLPLSTSFTLDDVVHVNHY